LSVFIFPLVKSLIFGRKLRQENNIRLSADFNFLYDKFNILFKNGWLKFHGITATDAYGTTLPSTSFNTSQENDFLCYIEDKLMKHKG